MLKQALACAAIVALTASAAAAAELDPHTNVATFTIQNLTTAGTMAGYQVQAHNDSSGLTSVEITSPQGLSFYAMPTACQKPGQTECYGLQVFGLLGGDDAPLPSLESLNEFNKQHAFTQAFVSGKSIGLGRYEISDYGIPIGNLSANYSNFAAVATSFINFLKSNGQSAAATPTSPHIAVNAFGKTPSNGSAAFVPDNTYRINPIK